MRLLVCGDRKWYERQYIQRVLEYIHTKATIDVIIEGGARGVDTLAGDIGRDLNIPVEEYLAEWNRFGKFAGPRRNMKMLNVGKPELVLAFHNNIGISRGTKHMMQIAIEANIPVLLLSSSNKDFYKDVNLWLTKEQVPS